MDNISKKIIEINQRIYGLKKEIEKQTEDFIIWQYQRIINDLEVKKRKLRAE